MSKYYATVGVDYGVSELVCNDDNAPTVLTLVAYTGLNPILSSISLIFLARTSLRRFAMNFTQIARL